MVMCIDKQCGRLVVVFIILAFITLAIINTSWARAGGGKSSGSAGSRAASSLGTTSMRSLGGSGQNAYSTQNIRHNTSLQQSSAGSFMRGLGGGLIGGFIGSMFFSGIGHAGVAPFSGGFGLLDVIIIIGGIYISWRFLKKRKKVVHPSFSYQSNGYNQKYNTLSYLNDVTEKSYMSSLSLPEKNTQCGTYDCSMDLAFDRKIFLENISDIFFKIQAAWSKRDLEPVRNSLTKNMFDIFSAQLQEMIIQGRINKLENVSIRSVEITKAWQEDGIDYITVCFFANLLDYVIDDKTDKLIMGSCNTPVKFKEFWTFTRIIGSNYWQLTAVSQES